MKTTPERNTREADLVPVATVKQVSGTVETDRLKGPFVNPAQVLALLRRAVDNDPGAERKLMLFYLEDGQRLELIETYSEARCTSMTFRVLSREERGIR